MTARHMQPLFSAGLWRTAIAGQQWSVSSCKLTISAASHHSALGTSAELQTPAQSPALPFAPKFRSFAAAVLFDTAGGHTDAQHGGHDGNPDAHAAPSTMHSSQKQQWRDALSSCGVVIHGGSAMRPQGGFSLVLTAQERAALAPLRHNAEGLDLLWTTCSAPECSHWSASSPASSPYSVQPINRSHSLGWGGNPSENAAGAVHRSLQHQGSALAATRTQGLGLSGGGSYGAAAGAAMGSQQVRGMAGGGGAWAKGHRSKMAMLRNKDGGDTGPQMRVNRDITAPEVRLVYEDNTHQVR